MKAVGVVLLVFGALLLAVGAINASKAPNVGYLVGSFLPGLICLIVGLKLSGTSKPEPGSHAASDGGEAGAI